ncbi:SPOR domain-containing protein [Methyloceanibacter sp.]|uniref:SPOR domain-containing protein n=1 Tax=Methyloceanibacter sp. TaxID=1965321 RepID=UPI002D3AAD59|nr:SPOR domain-containing protein [Methyloceanibacter sp.]HZP10543.1 SPOR domain-containing protein [Methyloceanibacter sp.]
MLVASVLPAAAEDAGLKNGAAALSAGKYDNAVRMLSSTVNSDNATPADAARALYLRGIAYRKLGQSARAISDLGAAIFLGLPEEDRVKALVNRGLAYQAAGLASQGEAEIAQARKAGGSGVVDQLIAEGGGSTAGAASVAAFSTSVTPEQQGYGSNAQAAATSDAPPRTASASGQWTTTANSETGGESASGNRVSRWWGSLTGSSSSSESASAPAPESAPPPASAVAKPPAAPSTGWGAQTQAGEAVAAATPPAPSTGWGVQTEPTNAAPSKPAPAEGPPPKAPSTGWGAQTQGGETVVASDATPSQSRFSRWFSRTAEADQAAPPQPAPASGGSGGFQLQLANSRSEAEAQALWKQVASANAALSGKAPRIEKVDIGNFGTFYSLKTGPFPDKAESTKVCNALKRSGVDCLVVSPDAQ